MSSFARLAGVSAKSQKTARRTSAKLAPRSYAHLNHAIPELQAAAEHRRAEVEKADEAQAATKLAKKMLSVAARVVR
jgi:hypothetical protein